MCYFQVCRGSMTNDLPGGEVDEDETMDVESDDVAETETDTVETETAHESFSTAEDKSGYIHPAAISVKLQAKVGAPSLAIDGKRFNLFTP